MKYWIISDTHLGHRKLCELSGRPENFDDLIIDNIQKMVTHDILIHLGDVCIGHDADNHDRFLANPAWKNWLVRGNHDSKSVQWYLNEGWHFCADGVWLRAYGKNVLFTHMPVADCGYDLNIHGHFHNANHRRHEPELLAVKNDKQYLFMLEHSYKPMLLEHIIRDWEKGARSNGEEMV